MLTADYSVDADRSVDADHGVNADRGVDADRTNPHSHALDLDRQKVHLLFM